MEIIYIEKGVYPILLLDDVFSELDKERRKYLSKSLSKCKQLLHLQIYWDWKFKKIWKNLYFI